MFPQSKIERNVKFGIDVNYVAYGYLSEDAINNLFLGMKNKPPYSLNIGYNYGKIYEANKTRIDLGIQLCTYGSQFSWNFAGSHGQLQPREVTVNFRYSTITLPVLVGYQKRDFYISGGVGIALPIYAAYPNSSSPDILDGDYGWFNPTVSVLVNCGTQFVLLYHRFSLEFQSSLFHYKYAETSNKYIGYFNLGIGLKFNFIREKTKTII